MPVNPLLEIAQVSSEPPYVAGLPVQLYVVGRASNHFTRVKITVRATSDPASGVIASGEVNTDYTNDPGVIVFPFSLVGGVHVLACNQTVHVRFEAVAGSGAGGAGGIVEDTRPILCKPSPASGGGSGGGTTSGGNGGGWDWPSWLPPPSQLCPMLGRSFAATSMGALIAAITAASLPGGPAQHPVAWGAMTTLFGLALAAWWAWNTLCQPNICLRLGTICWACKSAVLVGIPIAGSLMSVRGGLAVLIVGGVAGGLVATLRQRFCRVPTISGGLGQFGF